MAKDPAKASPAREGRARAQRSRRHVRSSAQGSLLRREVIRYLSQGDVYHGSIGQAVTLHAVLYTLAFSAMAYVNRTRTRSGRR